jgi:hypothetical protein
MYAPQPIHEDATNSTGQGLLRDIWLFALAGSAQEPTDKDDAYMLISPLRVDDRS